MKYVLVLLAIAVALVNAAEEKTTSDMKPVDRCYVCVSTNDTECGDSADGNTKFQKDDQRIKDKFLKTCTDPEVVPYYLKDKPESERKAKGCRKILQEVDSKTRVVRQCAYKVPDPFEGDVQGLKRTGNQGVRLFYYQCHSDACNGASTTTGAVLLSLVLPAIAFLLARW